MSLLGWFYIFLILRYKVCGKVMDHLGWSQARCCWQIQNIMEQTNCDENRVKMEGNLERWRYVHEKKEWNGGRVTLATAKEGTTIRKEEESCVPGYLSQLIIIKKYISEHQSLFMNYGHLCHINKTTNKLPTALLKVAQILKGNFKIIHPWDQLFVNLRSTLCIFRAKLSGSKGELKQRIILSITLSIQHLLFT